MASANNAFNLKGPKTGILVEQGGSRNSGVLSQPSSNFTNIDISKNPLFAPPVQPKISSVAQGTTPGLISPVKKSSADPSTLTLQKQLNQKNKGLPGWVALAEDGIFGPKTRAGVDFKPTPVAQQPQVQAPTPPRAQQPAPQPAPQAPQPKLTAPTYPGVVNQLLTKTNETYAPYTQNLADAGRQNQQYANTAQRIADAAGQTIANIGRQGAGAQAGYLSTGTSPVAEGNAAIIAQTTAAQQQAAAQGAQMQLAGVDRGLTAQSQLQSALGTAADQALTQRSQQLGSLGTTAGLLQPQVTSYGQTVFNPATGQFTSSADPSFNSVLQQYAQLRASGQESLIPSSISGNPVLNAQVTAMAQQANPNYNANTAAGQAAAQQSNSQTVGTVQTNTAAQGYQGAIQQYQEMNTQNSAADAQAQNVQNILASTGINSSSTDFNKALNNLKGRLGSTAVTKLVSSITELQAIYTTLLSAGGGTPTGNEQQALTVLNPNSSPAQIMASLEQLQLAAYNKLNAQYQQAQTYYSNLQGGGSSPTPQGGGSGSIYDF